MQAQLATVIDPKARQAVQLDLDPSACVRENVEALQAVLAKVLESKPDVLAYLYAEQGEGTDQWAVVWVTSEHAAPFAPPDEPFGSLTFPSLEAAAEAVIQHATG